MGEQTSVQLVLPQCDKAVMGGGAESYGGHIRAAPLGVRAGFLGTGEKPDSLRKGSGEEVFQVQETMCKRS